jgi:hypothetical protein
MSSDMVAYAEDRFGLVNSLMGKLKEKYSKPGKSYAELRGPLWKFDWSKKCMAQSVSRYIGGVMVDRSFVGQETTTKPFTLLVQHTRKKQWLFIKICFCT